MSEPLIKFYYLFSGIICEFFLARLATGIASVESTRESTVRTICYFRIPWYTLFISSARLQCDCFVRDILLHHGT